MPRRGYPVVVKAFPGSLEKKPVALTFLGKSVEKKNVEVPISNPELPISNLGLRWVVHRIPGQSTRREDKENENKCLFNPSPKDF